jgi:glycosyltransferase involved in cell wall biosynthesis
VVVLRGHQANPWELRPWELIDDRYNVVYLRSRSNWFATDAIGLPAREGRTLRDLLPSGRIGDIAVRVPGDRYLGLADELRGAAIVHAQELGYWYAMQAARLRRRLGFRLVLTVWETLPFLGAYRNVRTRAYRRDTMAQTDRFLAATQRAADSLLVEGVEPARVRVCPPGIDLGRFSPTGRVPSGPPLVLSPGRLVWEKGHQDLLRALALLRRRGGPGADARVRIVGAGPEEGRLRRYAQELGIADAVELRAFVPYERMPALYAEATCVFLGSLPTWSWEEQFGMVLVEAMASGVPIVASRSGAIPEVVGPTGTYVTPGDWVGLASALAEGPLTNPRPHRIADPERVERFSAQAAGDRLADAYDELLSSSTAGDSTEKPSERRKRVARARVEFARAQASERLWRSRTRSSSSD